MKTRPNAFTLIELLAVVLVVFIVAGLTLGTAKYVGQRANITQTKALLAKLELGIGNFKLDNGFYPTTSIYRCSVQFHVEKDNSRALYSQLTSPPKYLTFLSKEIVTNDGAAYIVDAWGIPINYYCPSSNVTYYVSNIPASVATNYAYGYIQPAYYYTNQWDSFTIGGLVNSGFYDLFSYGPNSTTYVPGGTDAPTGYSRVGWLSTWATPAASLDDIGNTQR